MMEIFSKIERFTGFGFILIVGTVTAFIPSLATDRMPTWVWQIIIGVTMLMSGASLAGFYDLDRKIPLGKFRRPLGFVFSLAGTIIFLNFSRYDEIVERTGSWPLLLAGVAMIFSSILMVALTILDVHPTIDSGRLSSSSRQSV